jgi:hypothetical protein
LAVFKEAGLEQIVLRAVQAAAERSREIATEFGSQR